MNSPASQDYIEHELEHFTQRFNWDCGVACVLMLLQPHQRREFLDNFDRICLEEGFGRMTWTIDLCYLLKRFGIKHTMYTTMLGVNEAHKQVSYYQNMSDQDNDRVTRRFANAVDAGLHIEKKFLNMEEIYRHLRRGVAIVLIDAGMVSCDLCKHNKLKADFRRCFGGSFSGHFVLVAGRSRGRLLYRDPALAARLCAAPAPRLQRARTAPTDGDVILVYNDELVQ